MSKNHFQTLGLKPGSSVDDVKKAYRYYASKYHPDKQAGDTFFKDRFQEVKEAYDFLMDDAKRKQLEQYLQSQGGEYNKKKSGNTLDDLSRAENRRDERRKKSFYLSDKITVNAEYVYANGQSYNLSYHDNVFMGKAADQNSNLLGIILVIAGIITTAFYFGVFLAAYGIYLIYKADYLVYLVGADGDKPVIRTSRKKAKRIVKSIEMALRANKEMK